MRELIRHRVFHQPVGSIFRLNLRFPWLRVMRLNSSSTLDLELVTGRTVVVPLVLASCGVMGQRMRLECPLCGQRVCALYYVDPRLACRRCNTLWYAAQARAATGERPDQAESQPEARRLWPDLERTVAAETARHVAADLRAVLCGSNAH